MKTNNFLTMALTSFVMDASAEFSSLRPVSTRGAKYQRGLFMQSLSIDEIMEGFLPVLSNLIETVMVNSEAGENSVLNGGTGFAERPA